MIIKVLVWIIVIIAVVVVVLLGSIFSGTEDPSREQARKQEQARKHAEQLIGFGFGEGVEISHWYCETIPDLIVSCSFSLMPEKHQELIRYCQEKAVTLKECKQEHIVPEGERECYCFESRHDGAPESFHLETAFVSLTTNKIYYYWADGS